MHLDDFARDTHGLGYSDEHVRVHSGRSTVGRIAGTTTGIARFFSPPFFAGDLAMSLSVNAVSHGMRIRDAGRAGHGVPAQWMLQAERWHPSHVWRRGAYHGQTSGGVLSLSLETRLIPSSLHDGLFLEVTIVNRGNAEVVLALEPDWRCRRFGTSLPGEWCWTPPCIKDEPVIVGPGLCRSVAPAGDRPAADLRVNWSDGRGRTESDSIELRIAAGRSAMAVLRLAWSKDSAPPLDDACTPVASLAARDRAWRGFWDSVPHLQAEDARIERGFQHALLTLFLSRWDSPHLDVRPHYAEAGINGGAFCNYTWGECYASKMMALIEGPAWKPTLIAHLGMGLESHYAFDPCGVVGVGSHYAYNISAITFAIEDYIHWTGDLGFLDEDAGGRPVWQALVEAVATCERGLPSDGDLLDYGNNHHLLEMRSRGYEHIVPSPNGERVRMYRFLAEVQEVYGDRQAAERNRQRAEAVRRAIVARLWDEEAGWLRCLRPDGSSELVFSIQIFDLLGLGILNPAQEARVVARINDREFLSSHGVNSIAKSDERHFDLGDVDWSGGGAFSGDPGNLIEALYVMDRADLAKQVMERILWWSDIFPYWPQSICAMKPDYSRWEQPINRSALSFVQAIVFGLFRLAVDNGRISFSPRKGAGLGAVHLSNLKAFGRVHEISA